MKGMKLRVPPRSCIRLFTQTQWDCEPQVHGHSFPPISDTRLLKGSTTEGRNCSTPSCLSTVQPYARHL